MLAFGGTVADFAAPVEADGPLQRMMGLAPLLSPIWARRCRRKLSRNSTAGADRPFGTTSMNMEAGNHRPSRAASPMYGHKQNTEKQR